MACYLYFASDPRMQGYASTYGRIADAVRSTVPLSGRQVAMVSWDGDTVGALALLARTRNSLSLKTSFSLTDFFELEPVILQQLVSELSEPHRSHLQGVLREGGELPAETAAELKRLFEGEDGGPWTMLEEMASSSASLWPEDREPVVAYEREAIGLALSLAGLDRDPVMKSWKGDTTRPFLTDLGLYTALESQILMQDARVFGDWSVIAGGNQRRRARTPRAAAAELAEHVGEDAGEEPGPSPPRVGRADPSHSTAIAMRSAKSRASARPNVASTLPTSDSSSL